jgi:hypothetical protein
MTRDYLQFALMITCGVCYSPHAIAQALITLSVPTKT